MNCFKALYFTEARQRRVQAEGRGLQWHRSPLYSLIFAILAPAIGITPKMLTSQLRELEEEGLISRKVYPEVPPKVEYSITEYGMTLKPILVAMHDWGTKYIIRKSEM